MKHYHFRKRNSLHEHRLLRFDGKPSEYTSSENQEEQPVHHENVDSPEEAVGALEDWLDKGEQDFSELEQNLPPGSDREENRPQLGTHQEQQESERVALEGLQRLVNRYVDVLHRGGGAAQFKANQEINRYLQRHPIEMQSRITRQVLPIRYTDRIGEPCFVYAYRYRNNIAVFDASDCQNLNSFDAEFNRWEQRLNDDRTAREQGLWAPEINGVIELLRGVLEAQVRVASGELRNSLMSRFPLRMQVGNRTLRFDLWHHQDGAPALRWRWEGADR